MLDGKWSHKSAKKMKFLLQAGQVMVDVVLRTRLSIQRQWLKCLLFQELSLFPGADEKAYRLINVPFFLFNDNSLRFVKPADTYILGIQLWEFFE